MADQDRSQVFAIYIIASLTLVRTNNRLFSIFIVYILCETESSVLCFSEPWSNQHVRWGCNCSMFCCNAPASNARSHAITYSFIHLKTHASCHVHVHTHTHMCPDTHTHTHTHPTVKIICITWLSPSIDIISPLSPLSHRSVSSCCTLGTANRPR